MLSRFGQECLLRGWTANSFEIVEDEDDNMVVVLKDSDSSDPDWLHEPMYGVAFVLPEDDLINIPGQLCGIKREVIESDYAY